MTSRKTKYGIKALTYICANLENAPIPTATIAKAENISHKFLESILLSLKKGGILASKKGNTGGYYLLKDPNAIYMDEVVRLLSGPIAMIPCVSLNFYETCKDCPNESNCSTHLLMLEVRDSTLKVLHKKTLAQLTKQSVK